MYQNIILLIYKRNDDGANDENKNNNRNNKKNNNNDNNDDDKEEVLEKLQSKLTYDAKEHYKENLVKVELFYEEFNFKSISEVKAYEVKRGMVEWRSGEEDGRGVVDFLFILYSSITV